MKCSLTAFLTAALALSKAASAAHLHHAHYARHWPTSFSTRTIATASPSHVALVVRDGFVQQDTPESGAVAYVTTTAVVSAEAIVQPDLTTASSSTSEAATLSTTTSDKLMMTTAAMSSVINTAMSVLPVSTSSSLTAVFPDLVCSTATTTLSLPGATSSIMPETISATYTPFSVSSDFASLIASTTTLAAQMTQGAAATSSEYPMMTYTNVVEVTDTTFVIVTEVAYETIYMTAG
ncbi:uncharacterized protein V2V93DRAFT_362044 [Kockiozyma suomiensis]|uniref:uncharacterized protein n=1 Tax=Kockiozyma suomiensis TaxID=1337062 RepID=UPI003343E29C